MVGKSLSVCIKDICEGRIDFADVEKIIAGTCVRNEDEFESLLENYASSYWREYPQHATIIATALWVMGKIDQPRVRGESPPNISNRKHWISNS